MLLNIMVAHLKKTGVRKMVKQICIDFDGVIHSYKSGWKGETNIPDEPNNGAFEWLVNLICAGMQPCIYSSRSRSFFGRRAMKKWFVEHVYDAIRFARVTQCGMEQDWWKWNIIWMIQSRAIAPWEVHCEDAAKAFVKKLKFPSKKPAAWITIDDRAICFSGLWPSIEEIEKFKPWYK